MRPEGGRAGQDTPTYLAKPAEDAPAAANAATGPRGWDLPPKRNRQTMISIRLPITVLAAAAMIAAAQPATAGSPPRPTPSMRAIVDQTSLVLEGDVTDVSFTYDEVDGPRTLTELSNVVVHLGDRSAVSGVVRLRSFGGPLPDGRRVDEMHTPTFAYGKRYLVFLRNTDWTLSPVVGGMALRVEEVAGKPVLVTAGGATVAGVGEAGLVLGAHIFEPLPAGVEPGYQPSIAPWVTRATVERALGARELVAALSSFSIHAGVEVSGGFSPDPVAYGPRWNHVPTAPGVPDVPDVDREPARPDVFEADAEAILACFEEETPGEDSNPEDVLMCVEGASR